MATRTLFECDLCKRPINTDDFYTVRRAARHARGEVYYLSADLCSAKCLAGLAFTQPERVKR